MKLIDADDFGKWLQNRGESWIVSENEERYNELGYVWNELERRASKSVETALSASSNNGSTSPAEIADNLEGWWSSREYFNIHEIGKKIKAVCRQLRACR